MFDRISNSLDLNKKFDERFRIRSLTLSENIVVEFLLINK